MLTFKFVAAAVKLFSANVTKQATLRQDCSWNSENVIKSLASVTANLHVIIFAAWLMASLPLHAIMELSSPSLLLRRWVGGQGTDINIKSLKLTPLSLLQTARLLLWGVRQ